MKFSNMPHLLMLVLAITISRTASAQIDLDNLYNYANQPIPNYIQDDNTGNNVLTDEGATLGRVLFYDKILSVNNTVACASCHQQQFAFGDTAVASVGVNGTTGRHSMRLINARFSNEQKFFWDERAATLEQQTTMPIQDHAEMGFSGQNGDPDLDSLIRKMGETEYYNRLFAFVYGDSMINEFRMQRALAQFVRSIQSFDAKYDVGRANAPNDNVPFNNFTTDENNGKMLFGAPPVFDPNGMRVTGGLGCSACHRAPEFDIDPNSENNGVIGAIGGGTDLTITRSPSMRDLLAPDGTLNGPMMHTGAFATLDDVFDHYNDIPLNQDIDPRLSPGGNNQELNLTNQERTELVAFLKTLTGTDVYTNAKWSNPFVNDQLTVLPDNAPVGIASLPQYDINIYPNPAQDYLIIDCQCLGEVTYRLYDLSGRVMQNTDLTINGPVHINTESLGTGLYILEVRDQNDQSQVLVTSKVQIMR